MSQPGLKIVATKRDITVLAIEPHPEDQKRGAYQHIKLSTLPPAKKIIRRKTRSLNCTAL
jgi:hypothetical protein